jgi:hypothetical protein
MRQFLSIIQHSEDLRIMYLVIDSQPILAVGDQTSLAQRQKMLRDISLTLSQDCLNMADADLARAQQFQDLQPRRMRQHAEHIGFKSIRDPSLFHNSFLYSVC